MYKYCVAAWSQCKFIAPCLCVHFGQFVFCRHQQRQQHLMWSMARIPFVHNDRMSRAEFFCCFELNAPRECMPNDTCGQNGRERDGGRSGANMRKAIEYSRSDLGEQATICMWFRDRHVFWIAESKSQIWNGIDRHRSVWCSVCTFIGLHGWPLFPAIQLNITDAFASLCAKMCHFHSHVISIAFFIRCYLVQANRISFEWNVAAFLNA